MEIERKSHYHTMKETSSFLGLRGQGIELGNFSFSFAYFISLYC
jgi:hypothetical protein